VSVPEVAQPGEHHGEAVFVGGGDHLVDTKAVSLCVLGIAGAAVVGKRWHRYRPIAASLLRGSMHFFALFLLKNFRGASGPRYCSGQLRDSSVYCNRNGLACLWAPNGKSEQQWRRNAAGSVAISRSPASGTGMTKRLPEGRGLLKMRQENLRILPYVGDTGKQVKRLSSTLLSARPLRIDRQARCGRRMGPGGDSEKSWNTGPPRPAQRARLSAKASPGFYGKATEMLRTMVPVIERTRAGVQ